MKSIGILVLMISVVVAESDTNVESINIAYDHKYHSFKYVINDKFYMHVYLRNIPSDVTEYILYDGRDKIIQKDNIAPSNVMIPVLISVPLREQNIEIKLKLYKKDMLCNHIVIARGTSMRTPVNNNITDTCLLSTPCVFSVNFFKTCFVMTKAGSMVDFYCETQNINRTKYILHQWMQFYPNGSFIGTLPQTQSQKSKFTIKAESFDNNTHVNCRSNSLFANRNTQVKGTILSVIDNVSNNKKDVSILRYSDTKEIKFYCENYLESTYFVQVGKINTTANKIKIIYDRENLKMKMADNGTVLCCIIYNIIQEDDVMHITRIINNKKLLIYDESVDLNGIAITISIILVVVLATVVLLGIFIYKKRNFESKPEEASSADEVELETHYVNSNPNTLCYAEFDMSVLGRPNRPPEESPYANIIGIVTPLNKQ